MFKTWRLLEYDSPDFGMNLAINEAIFRSRRANLTWDTLRLWRGLKAIILGGYASYKDNINYEVCRKYRVEIVRTNSVTPKVIYNDAGSLNVTFAINVRSLENVIKDYKPILSEYQILNESIARGLQKLGAHLKADHDGIYIADRRISEVLPVWFYEYLLFQVTLHIDTNLNNYEQIIKTKENLTSLSHELGKKMAVNDVKEAIVQGVEETFNVKLEEQSLTEDEQKLAEKLFRVKYRLNKWNINGHEPFLTGMGKTTVEVFVAYPPTSLCRKLIELVNEVVSDLQDEVRVMIWMRGRGIYQHGPHPEISPFLSKAHKQSIIPAVIINGELKFSGSIPSKEDLRKAILNAL
jgi:lipoate-protein ligase A